LRTDPDAAFDEAIRADNACFKAARRPGVTLAIHLCRGNNRSHWYAEGGYDGIAEKMFGALDVDRFLLEYDDERSGTFAPLRFIPKGKTVVLEWVNPECPFVMKHYDQSGNIPKTQQAATASGVVWLSINSAAPGKEGDYDSAQVKAWQARIHSGATAYFRDQDGKVGHLYDARTTPHMYVIDPAGTLVYAGGIDNIRSSKVEDIPKATNYVNAALADLKAGQPVRTKNSQPYGCSVKYSN